LYSKRTAPVTRIFLDVSRAAGHLIAIPAAARYVMRTIKIHIIAALAFILTAASFSFLYSEKKKRDYVGSEKCGICHAAETIGNQYDKWLRTPHAKAVLILRTSDAAALGKKLSIKNPAEDRQCLKCHATGGGTNPKLPEEGVGCEACHGPGSSYHEYGNHVDTVNRPGAYETALKNGMYPVLGISSIKKREKMCLSCHNSRRPCFPTTAKEIYRQSISLQVITDMKKGGDPARGDYVNLKHQLIPPFPQY
jgi:hypothetical protein